MVRKFSHLSFIILTLQLVVSCCQKSFNDLHFNAYNIKIHNTYNFRDIGDGVTINQEGYNIKILLSDEIKDGIENINEVRKSLDFCEDNEVTLNKDILNLSISCNSTIWNTAPGNPLNPNFIRIYKNNSGADSVNKRLTIKEWLNLINNEIQFVDFEWYMEFNESIVSLEFLKFNLHFDIEDGSKYTTETQSVKFE